MRKSTEAVGFAGSFCETTTLAPIRLSNNSCMPSALEDRIPYFAHQRTSCDFVADLICSSCSSGTSLLPSMNERSLAIFCAFEPLIFNLFLDNNADSSSLVEEDEIGVVLTSFGSSEGGRGWRSVMAPRAKNNCGGGDRAFSKSGGDERGDVRRGIVVSGGDGCGDARRFPFDASLVRSGDVLTCVTGCVVSGDGEQVSTCGDETTPDSDGSVPAWSTFMSARTESRRDGSQVPISLVRFAICTGVSLTPRFGEVVAASNEIFDCTCGASLAFLVVRTILFLTTLAFGESGARLVLRVLCRDMV